MNAYSLLLLAALAFPAPGDAAPGRNAHELTIDECSLALPDESDVEVPAPEAGRIESLEARQGYHVESEGLIGVLDDKLIRKQRDVAKFEAAAARKEAESDVNVRYAEASVKVAKKGHEIMREANRQQTGAIAQMNVIQKAFEVERAILSVEQAAHEQTVSEMTADGKEAALAVTEEQLERRQIKAPISGEIKELFKVKGEWVQAGEPLLRIVRLDTLRIQGRVNYREFLPGDVQNRPITFEVELKPGRVERVEGKVVFVDPQVSPGGQYVIFAEVPNRRDAGGWVLQPGLLGKMRVHINPLAAAPTPGPAAEREARAPR